MLADDDECAMDDVMEEFGANCATRWCTPDSDECCDNCSESDAPVDGSLLTPALAAAAVKFAARDALCCCNREPELAFPGAAAECSAGDSHLPGGAGQDALGGSPLCSNCSLVDLRHLARRFCKAKRGKC